MSAETSAWFAVVADGHTATEVMWVLDEYNTRTAAEADRDATNARHSGDALSVHVERVTD